MARSRSFLRGTQWRHAARRFLEGDASFRRYETLEGETAPHAILMDMAARPDGPPVRNGKPYSAIAHLAEDIRAVIAVNRYLFSLGYSAPETFACDLERGLAVIENLGSRVYGTMRLAGENMSEPMAAAVAVLADMAGRRWPTEVPVDDHLCHQVPRYDQEAQLIEADLLPSWFWPYLHNVEVPQALADDFAAAWSRVLPQTVAADPVWVLRDFHSPNLLWLPEREGLRRAGLIDTQDCLLGHPAYDLASLLQDARVDVPAEEEAAMFGALLRPPVAGKAHSTGRDSPPPTPFLAPSAPQKFSASSPGFRSATANTAISATCHGCRAISNAISAIRRWHRCATGMPGTCRKSFGNG